MSDVASNDENLMKTKEVMKGLSVSRGTVYNLIRRKLLASKRVGPRSIRVIRESYEAYRKSLPEAYPARVQASA